MRRWRSGRPSAALRRRACSALPPPFWMASTPLWTCMSSRCRPQIQRGFMHACMHACVDFIMSGTHAGWSHVCACHVHSFLAPLCTGGDAQAGTPCSLLPVAVPPSALCPCYCPAVPPHLEPQALTCPFPASPTFPATPAAGAPGAHAAAPAGAAAGHADGAAVPAHGAALPVGGSRGQQPPPAAPPGDHPHPECH